MQVYKPRYSKKAIQELIALNSNNSGSFFIGSVILLQNYDYEVKTERYMIANTLYDNISTQNVTLNNGDLTFDRIDLIVINYLGVVSVIEGVPSASPVKPILDADNEVEISFVLVGANTTADATITTVKVYDENLGSGGGEWNMSTTNPTNVTFDEAAVVLSGLKSIKINNVRSGFFADGNSEKGVDCSNLILNVRNDSNNNASLNVSIWDNGTTRVGFVRIDNGMFGYDSSKVGIWQKLVIPFSAFRIGGTWSNENFTEIYIAPTKNSIIYFDDIYYQKGVTSTNVSSVYIPSNLSEFTNDVAFITDAPQDGQDYIRNNGVWSVVQVASQYEATFESCSVSSIIALIPTDIIIKGSFFTPDMTFSFANCVVNTSKFISDNEYHFNITPNDVEVLETLTLNNGIESNFNVFIISNGTNILTSANDWVATSVDVSKISELNVTQDAYEDVILNLPLLHDVDYRFICQLKESPLYPYPVSNYTGLGIYLVDSVIESDILTSNWRSTYSFMDFKELSSSAQSNWGNGLINAIGDLHNTTFGFSKIGNQFYKNQYGSKTLIANFTGDYSLQDFKIKLRMKNQDFKNLVLIQY